MAYQLKLPIKILYIFDILTDSSWKGVNSIYISKKLAEGKNSDNLLHLELLLKHSPSALEFIDIPKTYL